MRRVFRLVRALGAGAAVVWGIARTLRRGEPEAPAAPVQPVKPVPSGRPVTPVQPVVPPRLDPEVVPELVPGSAETPVDTDAIPESERLSVPLGDLAGAVSVPAREPDVASGPLVIKGVSVDDPAALLALANHGSDDALRELGIKGKALTTLVEGRPYADAASLGDTAGVGRRTIQALVAGL